MKEGIISHQQRNSLENEVALINARIQEANDSRILSVSEQLDIVSQLLSFPFGQFLLLNKGLNGYWTDYLLNHSQGTEVASCFAEEFIFNRAPLMLATKQRHQHFLQQNQLSVKEGAKLACVPCGLSSELFDLNYEGVKDIQLIACDLDPESIEQSEQRAQEMGLAKWLITRKEDAFEMKDKKAFDLISSNGLTIYEEDDQRVADLYTLWYKALKPKGRLVTSFIVPPPSYECKESWDMSQVDAQDLALQVLIVRDIIGANFQCFRSKHKTQLLLEHAGFSKFEYVYDKAKIFPTVVATK